MNVENLLNSFVSITFGEYWETVKDYEALVISFPTGNQINSGKYFIYKKDHAVTTNEVKFFFPTGRFTFAFPVNQQIRVFKDYVIAESLLNPGAVLKLQFYKLTPILFN
jgi:hypothetical protein